MLSVLFLVYVAILWVSARAISKWKFPAQVQWWRTALIWVGLFVLTHADVMIGYFVEYRPMVLEAGDGRVLKRVVADGYLDYYAMQLISKPEEYRREPGLVLFEKGNQFRYIEMKSTKAYDSRLLSSVYPTIPYGEAQYAHFYRAIVGTPDCEAFNALPDATELREKYSIPGNECIGAKLTREPISRYEYKSTRSAKFHRLSPFYVYGHDKVVRDRNTGEIIVQCRIAAIKPQISRVIFFELIRAASHPKCMSAASFSTLVAVAIQPTLREHNKME